MDRFWQLRVLQKHLCFFKLSTYFIFFFKSMRRVLREIFFTDLFSRLRFSANTGFRESATFGVAARNFLFLGALRIFSFQKKRTERSKSKGSRNRTRTYDFEDHRSTTKLYPLGRDCHPYRYSFKNIFNFYFKLGFRVSLTATIQFSVDL